MLVKEIVEKWVDCVFSLETSKP